ncbi:hypothetical protein A7J50_1170 [Pseudomonas antarctica]|uniref:Uncharacterized protein n=1 Tax=Pseudomonas antarctica TaxID=219572 RepID=A0A172YXV9_9PSED|nr:hypothetical protein [Pseudomonas antarctica]ANF84609.1 hypothetical protein A7J50_1170 [Pseudomonas antarctica]
MSAIETKAQVLPPPERITVVLRAQEGETLEQVLPFVQLGAPVSIGRGLAVIAGASDEDLQMVLGKERDERFMDIERLESALEVDKHLAMAAPVMANLLKRIDVKVGGLMAVAGHGMAPSEEMWSEAEDALAEIELVLNLSQGKPYAPSHLIDEVPLEKFKDHLEKYLPESLAGAVQAESTTQIPGSFTTSVPTAFNATNVAVSEPFNIDDHVLMAANARRYEWLRDRDRVTDFDTDLCVARDDTVYFGHDLDKNVDDAMRLAHLEELHPCAD